MPELPEVETVARGLSRVLAGHVLEALKLRRPDLRFAFPPDLVKRTEGKRIVSVGRRAKYILVRFEDGTVMIMHLGMSGRMLIGPHDDEPAKHDHVIMVTDSGTEVRFNDARRFGFVDVTDEAHLAEHPMLKPLGPEPLDATFTGAVLAARLKGKITPIKAALLDQTVVAGLGNIYVSEALFQARISPRRSAATVAGARATRLVAGIKDVLERSVAAGGSSLRDYVQTSGELGYFQHHWAVYGREGLPCPGCTCTVGIQRITQSNRSTFYCAKKQR